jgi:hypothetical protein
VLRTFPIPGITIVRESEALYNGDFTNISPAGNVEGSSNWGTTGTILNIMDRLVEAESPGPCVKYFAIVPGQANQSGFSGCAVGRLAIGNAFSGSTMAHELAHTCSRAHAPCNVAGDACYPTYQIIGSGNHPSASIGEIGVDYVTLQVFDLAKTYDFMSYCGPTWVSPYTYEALMSCCQGSSGSGGGGANEGAEIELRPIELLYVHFMKYRDDVIVLRSPSFHLEGLAPMVWGQPTPYFVELHDREGRILEAERIYNKDFHTSFDSAHIDFSISLPWQTEAAWVVFKREDQVLHSVEVEETTPEVQLDAPFGGRTMTGQQTVSWSVSGSDDSMSYILRYSNDERHTWRAVATGIMVREWTLDFDDLPGGDKCMIQVLASAGFRTGKATSEPFIVTCKPRKPSIISPSNGENVIEGDSVHFFGFAHSPEGSAEPEALTWSSNIDGFLGSGPENVIHTLSVGHHRITLSTDDGCGGEASTSINLTVQPWIG